MKIIYFGTVCDLNKYDEMMKECRNKPSVATIIFETALLDGFKKNNMDVEVHSFPMIPTFPKSRWLFCFGKKEQLSCGYICNWLNTINLPIIKQFARRIDGIRKLKSWIRKYSSEGIIFTYSIPPFLAKDIIRYGNKYSVKVVAIIPDLLRDMYINENEKSLITKMKKIYLKSALNVQNQYDGYIYLTESMNRIVAPDKPYIVMEGIADISDFNNQNDQKELKCNAIMYAGMMHEKYGILNLADAFESLNMPEVELWLFGTGTAVSEIKKRAKKNKKIKYFGIVERETILKYEEKATLLVNPRNPEDEFTFYSFPSKTIEYMLSGTPVLTTKLKGIPHEYYNYVYGIESNEVEALRYALKKILSYPEYRLKEKGNCAKQFIIKEKNSYEQAKKIIEFMKEI